MTAMWEYSEVVTDVDESLQWDKSSETDWGGKKNIQREFFLNLKGAVGWELISSRYVVVRKTKGGSPIQGTLYDTFKREITSGISIKERNQEVREECYPEVEKEDEGDEKS